MQFSHSGKENEGRISLEYVAQEEGRAVRGRHDVREILC